MSLAEQIKKQHILYAVVFGLLSSIILAIADMMLGIKLNLIFLILCGLIGAGGAYMLHDQVFKNKSVKKRQVLYAVLYGLLNSCLYGLLGLWWRNRLDMAIATIVCWVSGGYLASKMQSKKKEMS